MLERELIAKELWERLSDVEGVQYTARNPKAPPDVGDLPALQFFEIADRVEDRRMRGDYPAYKRVVTIAVEAFVAGTSENAATKELGLFVQKTKKKLYKGGPTLGGTCSEMVETEGSRVLRPPAGEHVAGVGIVFEIRYTEQIALLYQ